ncbi:hypothetical protein OsI_19820 [Oryza sativa Indica Group]|uniref:Uncharacterized protein n=1 Tax=Oryza sativa subsp. indica TaxID=39946 RepID=B8AY27_ORYSI|nr:hypothetical protein OsI_19820 [Oryza sativa Indica Group]
MGSGSSKAGASSASSSSSASASASASGGDEATLLQAISWLAIALWPAISLPVLTIFLLLSNFGASICEVANDAIVAEAGKQATSSSGSVLHYCGYT